jgi:hypothetical protein
LLRLKVAVIGALDLSCLHEDLGRRAVDALLEACLPSVSVLSGTVFGLRSYRSTTWLRASRCCVSWECDFWGSRGLEGAIQRVCGGLAAMCGGGWAWLFVKAGVPGCSQSGVVGGAALRGLRHNDEWRHTDGDCACLLWLCITIPDFNVFYTRAAKGSTIANSSLPQLPTLWLDCISPSVEQSAKGDILWHTTHWRTASGQLPRSPTAMGEAPE